MKRNKIVHALAWVFLPFVTMGSLFVCVLSWYSGDMKVFIGFLMSGIWLSYLFISYLTGFNPFTLGKNKPNNGVDSTPGS